MIVVMIIDNGKGIPDQALPKIFENGFSHEKSFGTGLGLFHAKEYLEAWGGEIRIHSEEGVYTTVTIQLNTNLERN